MKTHPSFLCGFSVLFAATFVVSIPSAIADEAPITESAAVVTAPVATTPLEELVAPIALYPDALIALILPAATSSSDIVLAARFLRGGGSANQIDMQTWDDSVRGLAHYPDVVKWMDENLSWTQRLGEEYLAQPQAVMNAIQLARAQARARGILVDTPQQTVVVEDSYIRIIPARADVIYVPRYDPEVIYIERPVYYSPDPWLTFGIGFGVGSWLAYDLDWRRCTIWVDSHRHERWRQHGDWRHRPYPGRPGYVSHDNYWRQWNPAPGRPRPPHRDPNRWTHDVVRPTPLPGAPHFNRDQWKNRPDRIAEEKRPAVEHHSRDRSLDSLTRSARPVGSTTVHRPGITNQNTTSSTPANRQWTRTPATPVTGNVPAVNNANEDRQREVSERPVRQPGHVRSPNAQPNRGTVTTSPSDRRWQQPVASPSAPRVVGEGERRAEPATRANDRPIRAAMPTMRTNPSVVTQAAPTQAAASPAPAPMSRPVPQQREYRQPDRVARPAPVAVAPSAPARAAPAPAVESRGDHGSRATVSENRGEGQRRAHDRQQER